MLAISKNCRYFVYAAGTDMRSGFDSLSGIVRQEFKQEPLSGDIFIFLNKPCNRIKLLHWQGDGFAIFYKRLEKGTFELPKADKTTLEITPQQLLLIMEGIQLSSIKKRPRFSLEKQQVMST
jgi:transposase